MLWSQNSSEQNLHSNSATFTTWPPLLVSTVCSRRGEYEDCLPVNFPLLGRKFIAEYQLHIHFRGLLVYQWSWLLLCLFLGGRMWLVLVTNLYRFVALEAHVITHRKHWQYCNQLTPETEYKARHCGRYFDPHYLTRCRSGVGFIYWICYYSASAC